MSYRDREITGHIKMGDEFIDGRDGSLIKVIDIDEFNTNLLDITIDGKIYDCGCTTLYIKKHCVRH